ncbi:uncharacterized protein LOC135207899 [Macrobrachium nipponense]|uniref:uncharacterized protein LOC135207899 n=1 Tax=Macrobrachium nipponense TaxID=159736 RepID=UPI0030C803D1
MKQPKKRLLAALFVAALTCPGLEAAPRQQTSKDKHASQPTSDDGYDPLSKIAIDAYLHGPDVKYELKQHEYPYKQETPQLYKNGMEDLLKYLEKQFHFIRVVDKDEALATEVLDESWNEWLAYIQQIMPILSKFKVDASEIEDPATDAPSSIWQKMWDFLLKRVAVKDKDHTDVDGDGEEENDINVYYASVKVDPWGKLAGMAVDAIKQYSGYDVLSKWWHTTKKEFQKYITNPEEVIFPEDSEEEGPDKEGGGGGAVVAFPLPAGVLSISKYDPVSLGVNAILFIIWHSIFWGAYLPYSGVENLFYDYDYSEYDELAANATEAVPAAGEEGGEGEAADGEGEAPAEGDAPPAEGDAPPAAPAEGDTPPAAPAEGDAPPAEGDGSRVDSYSSYGYPEYYEYRDQPYYWDNSHFAVFSSKTGRAPQSDYHNTHYGSVTPQSPAYHDGGSSYGHRAHTPRVSHYGSVTPQSPAYHDGGSSYGHRAYTPRVSHYGSVTPQSPAYHDGGSSYSHKTHYTPRVSRYGGK